MENLIKEFLEKGKWVNQVYSLEHVGNKIYQLQQKELEVYGNGKFNPVITASKTKEEALEKIKKYNMFRTPNHSECEDEIYVTEYMGHYIAMD